MLNKLYNNLLHSSSELNGNENNVSVQVCCSSTLKCLGHLWSELTSAPSGWIWNCIKLRHIICEAQVTPNIL